MLIPHGLRNQAVCLRYVPQLRQSLRYITMLNIHKAEGHGHALNQVTTTVTKNDEPKVQQPRSSSKWFLNIIFPKDCLPTNMTSPTISSAHTSSSADPMTTKKSSERPTPAMQKKTKEMTTSSSKTELTGSTRPDDDHEQDYLILSHSMYLNFPRVPLATFHQLFLCIEQNANQLLLERTFILRQLLKHIRLRCKRKCTAVQFIEIYEAAILSTLINFVLVMLAKVYSKSFTNI